MGTEASDGNEVANVNQERFCPARIFVTGEVISARQNKDGFSDANSGSG